MTENKISFEDFEITTLIRQVRISERQKTIRKILDFIEKEAIDWEKQGYADGVGLAMCLSAQIKQLFPGVDLT